MVSAGDSGLRRGLRRLGVVAEARAAAVRMLDGVGWDAVSARAPEARAVQAGVWRRQAVVVVRVAPAKAAVATPAMAAKAAA